MQSIIDQNLLDTVRMWLEPLGDKSLPALNIQRSLFEILGKVLRALTLSLFAC
jgi:transcription factor SPN1